MIQPIIITREPDSCPKCGRPEDIVETCRHCGHEYEEEDITVTDVLGVIIVLLVVVWLLFTLASWAINDYSLVDILKSQWQWICSKKIY